MLFRRRTGHPGHDARLRMTLARPCSSDKRPNAWTLCCLLWASHGIKLCAGRMESSDTVHDWTTIDAVKRHPALHDSDLAQTSELSRPLQAAACFFLALQTAAGWQGLRPLLRSAALLGSRASFKSLAVMRDGDALKDGGLIKLTIPTPFETVRRLSSEDAKKLREELLELALEQEAQTVFRRSLDLVEALRTVGPEAAIGFASNDLTAPQLLRRMFEQLGGTYVKLGQFIASNPELFPAGYVEEFQSVSDATEPMPWSVVRPYLEEELRKPLGEVYASVDEEPLAASFSAQVHTARLVTGEEVVVKVQRKGIEGSFRADLGALYANARVLELLGVVNWEFPELVGTLRKALLEEIDFGLEAERTRQFAEFLDRSPELVGLVTVPKVYVDASSDRVITLERLHGRRGVPQSDSLRKYSGWRTLY